MANKSGKVLFVGLDSAEPRLLKQWCTDGALPNLNRIIKKSSFGSVAAPLGFGNSVFWSSFFTATNPAKHGQYYIRQICPGSYRVSTFVEDTDYKREPIWMEISRAGNKIAVIDMVRGPLTTEINGIQLVDWQSHDITGRPRSCPPALIAEISESLGPDPIGGNADRAFLETRDMLEFCSKMLRRIGTKTELSLQHLKQGSWDLYMTVFSEPHDIGHIFWYLHDPSHPWHDAELAHRLGDPIRQIYVAVDRAVGRLVEAAGKDTTVVLLAGPGMGPNYTANHLLDRVLLGLEEGNSSQRANFLHRLRALYRGILPKAVRIRLAGLTGPTVEQLFKADRHRGQAFVVPHNDNSGAIRINRVGREPKGVIRPGKEFDAYCEGLADSLKDLRNVETGKPVVDDVVRVDQIFQGENIDHLPDLLVLWNRDAPIDGVKSAQVGEIRERFRGHRSGDHTQDGLFVAYGPGVEAGELDEPVSPMDVGATVCSVFGVSPPDTDGTPVESFRKASPT